MGTLSQKDRDYVWHPFGRLFSDEVFLPVVSAKDAWLVAEDGKKYLDVNSSWWTILHGHGNEFLAQRVHEQFLKLDHVVFASVTHPGAVELAEKILEQLSGFDKVFFSDNGSTSVEVALKMVYQYWHNKGYSKKRFIALKGAYHGDTFGAMSVGQRGVFNKPFEHLFFEVDFLDFPTKENEERVLEELKKLVQTNEHAGFIFEPLVQGAAGMQMYSSEWLNKAIQICRQNGLLTIADEVMTGFYRTGTFFAMDQVSEKSDIVCLSKGLTGGVMPLGLTVASQTVSGAFKSNELDKALLHGHSFTGHALACASALASLELLKSIKTQDAIKMISSRHKEFVEQNKSNPFFSRVSARGTILAVDIKGGDKEGYFSSIRDFLYRFYMDHGFLIRPLGNTVFVNAPYCVKEDELDSIYDIILKSAEAINKKA